MNEHSRREPFPPRWAFLVLAVLILGALGWTVYNQLSATADRNVAQANSQTLAQDIQTVCATQGKLMVDDRDLCAKAEKVQQNPTEAIPGPKGEPGKDGANGTNGTSGIAGPKGDKGPAGDNGPAGASGANGTNGTDGAASTAPGPAGQQGTAGAPGAPGADSTVPGPVGPQGERGPAGADGAPGNSPTSFTFTDRTGTTYTCAPNPPGSSTYTCAADGVKP